MKNGKSNTNTPNPKKNGKFPYFWKGEQDQLVWRSKIFYIDLIDGRSRTGGPWTKPMKPMFADDSFMYDLCLSSPGSKLL